MYFAGFASAGKWLMTTYWEDSRMRPRTGLTAKNIRSVLVSTGVNTVIVCVLQFICGVNPSPAELLSPVFIGTALMAIVITLTSGTHADIGTVIRYYWAGFMGGIFTILLIGQMYTPVPTFASATKAMPVVMLVIIFLFYWFSLIRAIRTTDKKQF
jgi:hypothetical protein